MVQRSPALEPSAPPMQTLFPAYHSIHIYHVRQLDAGEIRTRYVKQLIQMEISLGFGDVLSTLSTLILIPSLYLVANDTSDAFKTKKHPSSF